MFSAFFAIDVALDELVLVPCDNFGHVLIIVLNLVYFFVLALAT